ncbi:MULTISPECIES: tripartite tricarboxylate transporter TctB family protein [Cytobacillus]|uniref:tripartite tricarboxylate transporter TctB family protein n=1 Tax=Cytobacillus TaxID=2675230 RepID=UPI00203C2A45|nr:tripartite tricarboxylate transporter TctB family protein [Cytobacillus kochii]MCM3320923.1 tripartite tricarboxylate transporter TctB family protein [Cytobacillus kochii]MCM3344244.1 tripartite tricarboxylate transporter TctB family protein [Cytobacillus kochii]MDM5208087.1 tripartite tricarboxylate transporter TctB family protein [Cytobacillus kochii]
MFVERYFGLFLLFISIVFLIMSFGLPVYSTNLGAVGAGFFPRIISILIFLFLCFHLIQVMRLKKKESEEEVDKKIRFQQVFLILLLAVTIGLSYFIGMLASIGVFMFTILAFVQKIPWFKAFTFTIVVLILMYLIFELWLDSPLPLGIFG